MRDAVRYKLIDGLAAFVLFVCCFPVHACWSEAAARYRLSTELLYAIARTESSLAPHAVAHNQDGTRDLGLMQVNSRWLPRLATYGISEQALLQPCTNINVGAWILAGNVKRLGYTWEAVGAYNAASPSKRAAYISRVRNHLRKLPAPPRTVRNRPFHRIPQPVIAQTPLLTAKISPPRP